MKQVTRQDRAIGLHNDGAICELENGFRFIDARDIAKEFGRSPIVFGRIPSGAMLGVDEDYPDIFGSFGQRNLPLPHEIDGPRAHISSAKQPSKCYGEARFHDADVTIKATGRE